MKLNCFNRWIIVLSLAFTASAQGLGKLPDFADLVAEHSPAVVKINTVTRSQSKNGSPNVEIPENVPEIFRHFF